MTRKFDENWNQVDPTPTPPAGGAGASSPDSPPVAKPVQGGLACPRCGCRHFEVISTRSQRPGCILRRRACRHCGHRVTTYERIGNPE